MRDEYKKLDKLDMSIWECCELLNEVVDESDPDLDDPQIEHLLQTAEAIRKDYPNEDWLHLTALIHGIHTCFIYIHVRKIQSALMTTAYNTYKNGKELLDVSTGKPATPFDIGAGHVDPVSALNPGLVYNASKEDYLNFLCALNYSSTEIKALYDKSFECVDGKSYRAEDLNYPSFEVPLSTTSGQTVIKYTRTLTNVGTPATYKVLASSKTHAVKIVVEPEELTFIKENEKKAYTVTFTATSMPPGTTSFGRLAWSGGKYVVSSPIAFTWD